MSDFDQEDIITPQGSDFDDADVVSAPAQTKPDRNVEVSQPEAFGIGAVQGSTFGTAPIASGLGGAAMDVIKGLGDKLGLTTDSQLEAQGFKMPEEKKGLEGLLSEYYDSRDRMKGLQDSASQQHFFTTIAGNIAPALATGGASALLKGVQSPAALSTASNAVSKILPSTENIANASRGMKIFQGVKEGAKAGALTGFGSGDAHLAEGDIGDTARETLDSAVGGGIFGGAIPVVGGVTKWTGNKLANVAKLIPGVKDSITAFKGGKAGISLDDESANNAIQTFSEDLLNTIQSQFRKAGMTKANALDYADEVGLRVNAGEEFQNVMDDIISRGASSTEDLAEKMKLYKSLKGLKDGPIDNLQAKQDLANAKIQQKMEAKGYTPLDSQDASNIVQDFNPTSDAQKKLLLTNQTYQAPIVQGAEEGALPVVSKLIQQAGDELPINIKKYDLDNLSLRDLNEVIGEVNRHTGDLTGPAKTVSEQKARALAGNLRKMSEDALDDMGNSQTPAGTNILGNTGLINGAPVTSGNKALSRTFSALDRAGINDNVLTNNPIRKNEMVDKLRNTVTSTNHDRQRVFEYLNEADPKAFQGMKEGADFLRDFNKLAAGADNTLSSSNIKSVGGPIKNMIYKGANAAGKVATGLTDLIDVPVEKLSGIAQKMGMSDNKAAQQFSSPLLKAAQTTNEQKRNAILYGLYQQPAFRDVYQTLGEAIDDTVLPVGTDREDKN